MKKNFYTSRTSGPAGISRFLLSLVFFVGLSGIMATYGIPLSGAYTINAGLPTAGTNFQSFTAFANSINTNGISGNVITSVVPGSGPYNEQVTFSNIAGTSATASVTLEGNGESISAVTTSTNRHVVRLSNCQYFTINGLNINWDPISTGGFYAIHIFGTGNHITISNCNVDLSGTTSTLYGAFVASGSETSILVTGDFHNINITGNTANGGGYGASLFGLVSNLASHVVISGNTFWNAHSNGVYLRETDSAVVSGNFFDKTTANVTSCNFIQLAQAANINGRIHDNHITLSQTANGNQTIRGIYLFNGAGHKVYNNEIYDIHLTSGEFTGIEIRTANTSPEIYFNTISYDNTATSTADLFGIKEELSNTNTILRNNLISISQTTSGTKTGLMIGTNAVVTSAFNSNYNDIWVPGGNVAQKGTSATYATLANWQAASGQDLNSNSLDPVLVSASYVQPTNGLLNNTGTPLSGINTDITGANRGVLPDVGAYEFSVVPPEAPVTIFGDTVICENSTSVNYYISPVTGATSYTWTIAGATLINGQGTTSVLLDFNNSPVLLSVFAVNSSGSSSAITINITLIPQPIVSLTLVPDAVMYNFLPFALSGGTPPGGTYSGPGVAGNIFTPGFGVVGINVITYTYTDTNNCWASATDIMQVLVDGIPENTGTQQQISTYPNPCSVQCTVSSSRIEPNSGVKLYNRHGVMVRDFVAEKTRFTLHCKDLPGGLYILQITTPSGKIFTTKIDILE